MRQPPKLFVCGIGVLFTAHPLAAGYGDPRKPDDLLQPPPLAAVVVTANSTGSISNIGSGYPTIVSAITDELYDTSDPARPGRATVQKS